METKELITIETKRVLVAFNDNGIDPYIKQAKELADRCRGMGLDPTLDVESKITFDLADRIESLMVLPGIAERLRQMFSQQTKEETALKIAEELALGRYGNFKTTQELLDTAVRLGLAVITSLVITSDISVFGSFSNIKSLAVIIPTSFLSGLTIKMLETDFSFCSNQTSCS